MMSDKSFNEYMFRQKCRELKIESNDHLAFDLAFRTWVYAEAGKKMPTVEMGFYNLKAIVKFIEERMNPPFDVLQVIQEEANS